jgi:hypothetical protein
MPHDECPVCRAPFKEYMDTVDWGGPIAEHYQICPNGCYSYEFAYGYTTVLVKGAQFGWTYETDAAARQAEIAAMEVAIEAARENQARRPQEQS